MQNISQTQEFIYFCLIGIVISFIFDIFRSIRKNFNTTDNITYVEDILFLVISTIIIMYGVLEISNGILRFYIFLGTLLGITIYTLTFSKFCIIIFDSILVFCKKTIEFIKNIIKSLVFFFKKLGKKK